MINNTPNNNNIIKSITATNWSPRDTFFCCSIINKPQHTGAGRNIAVQGRPNFKVIYFMHDHSEVNDIPYYIVPNNSISV